MAGTIGDFRLINFCKTWRKEYSGMAPHSLLIHLRTAPEFRASKCLLSVTMGDINQKNSILGRARLGPA